MKSPCGLFLFETYSCCTAQYPHNKMRDRWNKVHLGSWLIGEFSFTPIHIHSNQDWFRTFPDIFLVWHLKGGQSVLSRKLMTIDKPWQSRKDLGSSPDITPLRAMFPWQVTWPLWTYFLFVKLSRIPILSHRVVVKVKWGYINRRAL